MNCEMPWQVKAFTEIGLHGMAQWWTTRLICMHVILISNPVPGAVLHRHGRACMDKSGRLCTGILY